LKQLNRTNTYEERCEQDILIIIARTLLPNYQDWCISEH